MSKYPAHPKKLQNFTQSGEDQIFVGKRNVTDFLPGILQTDTNKRFLSTTLDQLLSSGSTETLDTYWGRVKGKDYKPGKDLFNPESSSQRLNHQLAPGISHKDGVATDEALSYNSILNLFKTVGSDTAHVDQLANEAGYTLDIPINVDMFINHTNYYWLMEDIPPCVIAPTIDDVIEIDSITRLSNYTTPTLSNGKTLELVNGMRVIFTPADTTIFTQTDGSNKIFPTNIRGAKFVEVFQNGVLLDPGPQSGAPAGMHFPIGGVSADYIYVPAPVGGGPSYVSIPLAGAVQVGDVIEIRSYFTYSASGDYKPSATYWVEGVGTPNIKLVEHIDANDKIQFFHVQPYTPRLPSDWDLDSWDSNLWDYSNYKNPEKEYVVADRSSVDKNAWARANQWYSIYAIRNTVDYNDLVITDFNTTANRGQRPIICWENNLELINSGQRLIRNVNHVTVDIDPSVSIIGQPTYTNALVGLANDDYVLVLNGGSYSNGIYQVSGVDTSITFTEVNAPNSYTTLDKVLVLHGPDLAGTDTGYPGIELYWDGSNWINGQQKQSRGDYPLFELYDEVGEKLSTYQNNDYAGDKFFGYEENTAGIVDPELGFAPKYNTQNNNNDINFFFNLNVKRYQTDLGDPAARDITGYYFAKDIVNLSYLNGWSQIRDNQRTPLIKTHIATADEIVKFTLASDQLELNPVFWVETTDLSGATGYRISNEMIHDTVEYGETDPDLILQTGVDYTFKLLIPKANQNFRVTNPYGVLDPNISITTTGNNMVVTFGANYAYTTAYYMSEDSYAAYGGVGYLTSGGAVATPKFAGRIFINNNNHKQVHLLKNGNVIKETTDYTISGTTVTMTSPANKDDVYEIEYIVNTKNIDTNQHVFDTAPVFKYNPNNETLSSISFSNILHHYSDQAMRTVGFTGDIFGENNLHKISNTLNSGGTIRQQVASPTKVSYLLNNPYTNPINGLRKTGNDYYNFKEYFKTKVKQIWNTSLSTDTIRDIVDKALTEINIGKNTTFNYSKSDMVYYNSERTQTINITNATTIFYTDNTSNMFNDSHNHVYVYIKDYNGSEYVWRPLQRDIDYTINIDELSLTTAAVLDSSSTPAQLEIRWYDFNNYSYIPPSTVKLGLIKPYTVEVVNGKLLNHDGSVHVCDGTEFYNTADTNFDIVSACLLELETRIVAGLIDKHYIIQQQLMDILPNANRTTSNSWADMADILDDWYNSYATKNNLVGFNSASYYDVSDEFTWNYSSVGPKIGSWKGIYSYYFGTDRPDTHPWRMLGHHRKPSWWDTNYSWTDPTKRAALIASLKIGEIGDPSLANRYTDVLVNRSAYDWDNNTLVTTGGTINGPVTAGVVPTPTAIEQAKNFQFNDWGPIENSWRSTSLFTFALAEAALLFKPFRVFENFYKLNHVSTIETINTKHAQRVIDTPRFRSNLKNTSMHQQSVDKRTIINVVVDTSGSGYNNSTTIDANNTKFGDSKFTVRVAGGEVKAIGVAKSVAGYSDNVSLSISGPIGASGATASGFTDIINPVIPGLNSIVVEWASNYNITPDDLIESFGNLQSELMIPVGGYTDKNIISVLLDSSYQKGPVEIPKQDYSIVLTKSSPIKNVFYSGLKITKGDFGYSVTGFDTTNRTFTVYPVSEGGHVSKIDIGNLDVKRFHKYRNNTVKYTYGHTFLKRQDLFNFILGLGEYYQTQGFEAEARWLQDARTAMEWSLSESPSPLYINGVLNTLEFTQGSVGYVDYIGYSYDGTSNIINSDNKQIKPSQMLVLRNDTTTEFSLKDTTKEMFGLNVSVVEYEHIITLNNLSQFSDITYDPVTGISHTRIKLEGERTRNWNGRIEAPGYLVKSDGIMSNLETSVREVERDNINSDSKTLNLSTRQTARFNTGYIEGSYLSNTFIEDNAGYNFGKGLRKMKGTTVAVDAFMRNQNLFGTTQSHDIYEEWMVRLGDYGDTQKRNPIEIQLDSNLLKTNPQAIRFNENYVSDNAGDLIIDYHSGSTTLITGDLTKPFDVLPPEYNNTSSISVSEKFKSHLPLAGLPLASEAEHKLKSIDDIGSAYSILEDYATLPNWSAVVAYKTGDMVRKDGKVYQLNIATTGLSSISDTIILRGSTLYPSVPSGETLIIDGTTITISKTSTTTAYDVINVDGTINNPTAPNNSTLIIDGSTIVLDKTITTTNYAPIVVTGTVGNPTVTGNVGEGLLIDGTFVDLVQNTSITTNISALSALEQGFSPAFVTSASENTVAVARINALEDLRVAYTAIEGGSAWTTWIGNYYTGTFANSGLNIPYLSTELSGANAGYSAEITTLLQNDVDIVNACTNQSYTTGSLPTNSDRTTSVNALATGTYIDDFATFVKIGGSILTGSTVATVNTTVPRIFDIDDLISEIQSSLTSAGNSTITPSKNATNQLVITKTASAGDSSLTIGSAGSNTEVGFSTNSQVYNSQTSTVVSGGTLNLNEIIQEINEASLSGVSASANGTQLRIQSVNQTITIGSGTANGNVGIGVGTTNATTTVTTSPTDSQIYDIVDQINSASISGITAANVNNNLVLNSTNDTLVIGSGTANVSVGISAGTITASTTVTNTFSASDWNQIEDPANAKLSTWVLDNIGITTTDYSRSAGYNVYQTFDYDFEITEICAGNETGDDALIKTSVDHNLSSGDYVVIINSTSTPSVDGIHQVTRVDDSNHFYIDKYIESLGKGGKLLALRPTKFNNNTELTNTLTNSKYYNNLKGWRVGMLAYVDNVITNSISTNLGAVYQTVQGTNGIEFKKIRDQAKRTDNSMIKNAILYNTHTQQTVQTFEVFHPLAGIIPGVVDTELSYKLNFDTANYTNTTDSTYSITDSNYWDEQHIGETWWDISNAVYYDYEQGDLVYKQSWWATLFPTSSIDIYEWTKSTVTPDEYEAEVRAGTVVDGIQLSGTPYIRDGEYGEAVYYWTELTEYNISSEQEETFYYFWVKNKTTKTGDNRQFTTTQLTNILSDPSTFGYNWIASSGSSTNQDQENSILVSNLETFINNGESALQLNFANSDIDLHREYVLLAENDPATVIPEWLHMGLRDSIASFDKTSVTEPYAVWNASASYTQGELVQASDGTFHRASTSNVNNDPVTDSANTWSQIYVSKINPDTTDIDINQATVEIPQPNPVPDSNLHPLAQYGSMIRPRQSWIKYLPEARRVLVDKLNRQLLKINLIDTVKNWDKVLNSTIVSGQHSYKINDYWSYTDWMVDGFIIGQDTDRTVTLRSELALTPGIAGETARVLKSSPNEQVRRQQIFKYSGTTWELQFKEKATIQFKTLLWDYNKEDFGWDTGNWDFTLWDHDPGAMLGEILDTLRFDIFVGQYQPLYADMWFTMLNYVNSEQNNLDWAFKSTYIKAVIKHNLDKNTKLFELDRIDDVIDYINDIKPFHTKMRNLYTQRDHLDQFKVTAQEIMYGINITEKLDAHANTGFDGVLLEGGSNWAIGTNTDTSLFTTQETASGADISNTTITVDASNISIDGSDSEFTDIYATHGFLQPQYAGHGTELYPAQFDEALELRVTTNVTGSTEDANSKRFRMFMDSNRETEAVVINVNTTLSGDITLTDTSIPVTSGSVLYNATPDQLGVIWIGNERITYTHIDNDTLINCTRGTGGTCSTAHSNGDTVYESGPTVRIPALDELQDYGQQLLPAFNDFGKSITDATSTSSEAKFVYDNG